MAARDQGFRTPDQASPAPRRAAPESFAVPAEQRPPAATAVAEPATGQDQLTAPANDDAVPDPAPWVPTKVLMMITAIAVIALIVTVIVCLLLWITPPLQPMDVPTVPAA